ncbi:hypothetical protein [Azospirillum doebereinerae]
MIPIRVGFLDSLSMVSINERRVSAHRAGPSDRFWAVLLVGVV